MVNEQKIYGVISALFLFKFLHMWFKKDELIHLTDELKIELYKTLRSRIDEIKREKIKNEQQKTPSIE